jgi:peptidoglycan/xylan/chitin deacetylase (PgdA/CDA1 family)
MHDSSQRRRTLLRNAAVVTGVGLALSLGIAPAQAAITDPPTVVSFTFDDGNADQMAALPILDSAGMKGTFFITTGWIGAQDYMTQADLATLKAGGHEIGGHTVSHPDLTLVPADEVTKQICQGRNTLAGWGYPTTSFAYPYASLSTSIAATAQACGFNSARNLGDTFTRFGGTAGLFAETVPPLNAFETRAPDEVDSTWTLADLQKTVTDAETAGGGWVQLTFHHVCAGACDPLNLTITPTLLQEFVDWLKLRAATNNTTVKTVDQVVGGAVKPLVPSTNAFRPAPAAGVNGVLNPSLETPGLAGQTPQCWQPGGFGISTRTFTTVTAAHTGTAAVQMVVTGLVSGDAKLALTQDLGTCAPTATPGRTYSLRAWYNSTANTQFDVYYRNAVGGWIYWTSSPFFSASPTYRQAVWQSPPVPAGATGLSFGLNLITNGTVVTDDYELYDKVGAPGVVEPLFADVTSSSPFFTYIQWMAATGISTGTVQTSGQPLYVPLASVSREAMAAFMFRMSGETFTAPPNPSFADVSATSTFFKEIQWMASKGISTGSVQAVGNPLYKPADPVSREAMALFLARYAKVNVSVPPSIQAFADVGVTSFGAAAISWMKSTGISTGTVQSSGLPLYKPNDPVSRQAMAAFLYRLAQLN